MQLYTIDTGFFKLDGGAMFGVVPRVLWSKTNPPDENNLCPWAMRSLLIEDGNKLILIDNGIGDKQDDKFLRHYYLHGDVNLQSSLAKHGFSADDITDVFLTHLHFDHCADFIRLFFHRWDIGRPGLASMKVFDLIGYAITSSSPNEAKPNQFFLNKDKVVINRDRQLTTAINLINKILINLIKLWYTFP